LKIAIVTDAWHPQTNGVVTTLSNTRSALEQAGHEVVIVAGEGLPTVPLPSYPEIRLVTRPFAHVADRLRATAPDAIHIATEGPLGLAARRYCRRRGLRFTTSYHTRFPEYAHERWRIPLRLGYSALRWVHSAATRTLVATPGIQRELAAHGFRNLTLWSRGVDLIRFCPQRREPSPFDVPLVRPIQLYAGRVAVEKNLEAFLGLRTAGTKVVVGEGPALDGLRRRYPDTLFTGYRYGDALVRLIAAADVFVFPSRTDTFGLVIIEALACGVPVAAFPVTGPADIIEEGVSGALNGDLAAAIAAALPLSRHACRIRAEQFTWERASRQFLAALVPAGAPVAVEKVDAAMQQSVDTGRIAT
jgi:glycosyltransferase involved in cell wall biosynthesis